MGFQRLARRTHAPFVTLVVVLSAIGVLVLASQAWGATPNVTLSAPFSSAQAFGDIYRHHTNGAGSITIVSRPAAIKRTGGLSMDLAVDSHGPKDYVYGEAGFKFPFTVSTSGTHTFAVNVSLHWHANDSGRVNPHKTTVAAYVDMTVDDVTKNGGVSWYSLFVDLSQHPGGVSTGFANVTLHGSLSMNSSDTGMLIVQVTALLNALGAGTTTSGAYFDLAGQYGATLNWVTIQ